jgi:ABC-2 type transport system permease protein
MPMRRMLAIAKKEFIHIRRDPRTIAAVLIMPMLQLLLFSYALSNDITNVPTAVLDRDSTQVSRQYVGSFEHSNFFEVTQRLSAMRDVDGVFDRGEDKVVIVIEPGFADAIRAGRDGRVAVLVDGSDPNSAQRAQGVASGLSQLFGGEVKASYFLKRGVDVAAMGGIEQHQMTWYNPEGRQQFFLIPGLIVILIMGTSIQQTAIALAKEKEMGTMEQLVASPIRRLELMVGKVAPWAVLAVLDVILITLFGVLAFQIPFRGSVMLFAVASLLFVLGNLGLGLWISSIASGVNTANQISALLSMLPGFMLSGFIFSIRNMPPVLQGFTYIFPARYFMTINRTLFLKGTGLAVLWPEFAALAAYAALMLFLSAVTFKKRV